MLKMMAAGLLPGGKPSRLLMLGLSHVNLERLKAGQPIKIDCAEFGLADVEIVIFAGETEASMAAEVQELVGPGTKVRIDPRLRN